nr:Sugar diacid utilization regulator [Klebsiella pneumoniae]
MLLDTLSSFIANNAEPGKTSLLLGIHRNTLTYRLQQIKSIYSSIRWSSPT